MNPCAKAQGFITKAILMHVNIKINLSKITKPTYIPQRIYFTVTVQRNALP